MALTRRAEDSKSSKNSGIKSPTKRLISSKKFKEGTNYCTTQKTILTDQTGFHKCLITLCFQLLSLVQSQYVQGNFNYGTKCRIQNRADCKTTLGRYTKIKSIKLNSLQIIVEIFVTQQNSTNKLFFKTDLVIPIPMQYARGMIANNEKVNF